MSRLHVSRTFKIIYSCIVWLLFLSLVHPAFGAWDSLSAEVTFTAQTGVWTVDPAPIAEAAPQQSEAPVSEVQPLQEPQSPPNTPEPEVPISPETPDPSTPTPPTAPEIKDPEPPEPQPQ